MLNKKSLDLIHSFEGVRLSCYHLGDGVCTIGYGHTRPLSQCAGAGSWKITQQQADDMFASDIKVYENAVDNYFTRSFNDNQRGALVSFCYNLGTGIFAKHGWSKTASDSWITSQMPLYRNPGTQFEQGLLRRRNAEVALYNDKVSEQPSNNTTVDMNNLNEEEEIMFLTKGPKELNYYLVINGRWSKVTNTGMLNNIRKTFPNIPTLEMLEKEVKSMFAQNK